MDRIKVVIRYEDRLESISVDDNNMDIHAIRDSKIEDWFEDSKNRAGWKGLKAQIYDMIEDDEAALVFQFIGPENVKQTFVDLLIKYNLGNHADGIDDKDYIEQNMAYAQKYEHIGDFDKAFQLYKDAADKGDAEAQFNTAAYYYKFHEGEIELSGEDKTTAFKKAAEYYEKAAEQNHTEAQYVYYQLYCEEEIDIYIDNSKAENAIFDSKKAVAYLTKAAQQGHDEAELQLGFCYYTGKGLPKKEAEAFQWFAKSANQGNPEAQYMVGRYYLKGLCLAMNPEEAFRWFSKSAKQGYSTAQYELAKCYELGYGTGKNPEKAFEWYLKAAEQGDPDAQYALGRCYQDGYGTEENPEEAFEWYMKATEQDDNEAQYQVGRCYERGYATEKKPEEAYNWYLKSADNGCGKAMYALGDCFIQEIGVKIDFEEAIKWYMKALENGYGSATDILGTFYSAIEKYPNAIQYYKKIAEELSTDGDAYFNIAEIYYKQFKGTKNNVPKGVAATVLTAAALLVPITNIVTIPAAAAGTVASAIIKDKVFLKSEKGQEMIKYYKKAAELGHEEAKKKYEKYKKYLKQG